MLQFDQIQTPVWIYDTLNYRISWANRSALKLWQADSLEELVARDFRAETSEAVHRTLLSYLEEFEKSHTISRWWRLTPKGQVKDVYCQFSGVQLEGGRMAMLVEGLEIENQQFSPLFSSAAAVSLHESDGRLISANPALAEQFGGQIRHLEQLLKYPDQAQTLLNICLSQGYHQEDIQGLTLRGERWCSIELRRTCAAGKTQLTVTLQDIHDRKNRELQFEQMALLDPLTGLLNRAGLTQKLSLLINSEEPFTLFYLDLDGFKPINDNFGHAAGDEMLVEIASRLTSQGSDQHVIARLGGDEFVIAIENSWLKGQERFFAEKLVNMLSGQYRVAGRSIPIRLSISVGIASYPKDEVDLSLLLADADTAMYVAKNSKRRSWIEYRKGMREQFHRRMLISQQLSGALANGEFSLAYQPVFDVSDGSMVLVEALLRWNNTFLGEVCAEELIDAAESCGLIREVSSWVFHRACQDFSSIRSCFGDQALLSVNISGMHIVQGGVVEALQSALDATEFTPADIVLELTEKMMLPQSGEHSGTIDRLSKEGFGLAIDDFGAGFSCLAYLNSIPANWVKLDREFVLQLDQGSETIRYINQLVNALGMKVIIEGVEEVSQSKELMECGVCNQQGFLHSKPVELEQLLSGFLAPQQVKVS